VGRASGRGTKRILANVGWRALSDVGSKAIMLLLYVVMARELGEASFGVFTFGLAFGVLVTTLASFGQDGILTREVARDPSRLDHYLANTLAVKLALSAPALALALLVAWAVGTDERTRLVILFLGLGVIVEQLVSTCFAAYQAFEQMALMPAVIVTQRVATTIPAIAAMMLGAGVVAVSAIYFAGTLTAIALALVLLVRRVARPRAEIDLRAWWPLMRVAAPLGLSSVFLVVLTRIDTTMLASFESDEVVGNYGAAYRLFEATLLFSWSVTAAVYPVFSRLTRASTPPVALVYERALKLAVAPTLPLAAGAVVLSDPLVRVVYGDEFSEAGPALALMAPAILLYPLAHVSGVLLVSQNRQTALAVAHGAVAVENVSANFILIPLFSLEGAAAGVSISQGALAVALIALARRTAGSFDAWRIAAGPTLAGAAAVLAMIAFRDALALAVVAAAVVYTAVAVLFERRFYPEDARAIGDFFRRRSIAQA
jgi:O-antigen/teichoic acid export membrane protein